MNSSGVTAVIVTYWPSRQKFLPEIIESFKEQTTKVDRIIIWNNHPDPIDIPGAIVFNSNRNLSSRAKYAAAISVYSPYYLLIDDDIKPRHGLVEHFLHWAKPGCCLSLQGFQMTSNYLSRSKEVNGNFIDSPSKVDAFIGITQFLSIEAIAKMLTSEFPIRDNYLFDGEDILVAMVNENAMVVPIDDSVGAGYFPIDGSQKESMNGDLGYVQLRDEFTWKCWNNLRNGINFGDGIPGESEEEKKYIEGYREKLIERYGIV